MYLLQEKIRVALSAGALLQEQGRQNLVKIAAALKGKGDCGGGGERGCIVYYNSYSQDQGKTYPNWY